MGYTASPVSGNISQPSQGGMDIWLIKIDSSGNKLWDQRFGGSGSDLPRKIIPTTDKGYILCGRTFSPQSGDVSEPPHGLRDMWVIKLDSVGNKLWDKRYGGTGINDANWIEQDFDGGYLIGGTTTSPISLDVSESPFGVGDYWIIKTDSIGNKIWDKRFGGPGDNILTCFALLPDSSIMLFGYADSGTTSVKTHPGNGLTDYWLVHFKYNNSPIGINELSYDNQSISIYPNPVTDELLLHSQSNLPLQYFRLYDLTGRLVYEQLEFDEKTVNISQLKPAIYFYQILGSRNNFYNGKLLKQ
ncbi:MAG: T9SS type A sorting domain-containing protein [Bacteroidetes bacterium]|nr:T9SS type A sorting domain-containing protein [Bacteroidota bacterium]